MANATTNMTTITADAVSIWNPAAQDSQDLHQIFINTSAIVEPHLVSIPNADAAETELRYNPGPGLVPALDGMISYIAQETAKPGTVNKSYSTTRKPYHFLETYSPLIYQKNKKITDGYRRQRDNGVRVPAGELQRARGTEM